MFDSVGYVMVFYLFLFIVLIDLISYKYNIVKF